MKFRIFLLIFICGLIPGFGQEATLQFNIHENDEKNSESTLVLAMDKDRFIFYVTMKESESFFSKERIIIDLEELSLVVIKTDKHGTYGRNKTIDQEIVNQVREAKIDRSVNPLFTLTSTGEKRKIGKYRCKKYLIGENSYVWLTKSRKIPSKDVYERFSIAISGEKVPMEGLAAFRALKKKGFPVVIRVIDEDINYTIQLAHVLPYVDQALFYHRRY